MPILKNIFILRIIFPILFLSPSCKGSTEEYAGNNMITVEAVYINNIPIGHNQSVKDISVHRNIQVKILLSEDMDTVFFSKESVRLSGNLSYTYRFAGNKKILCNITTPLEPLTSYRIDIPAGQNSNGGNVVERYTATFTTTIDSTHKFPLIGDDELLTKVQAAAFRYFRNFAHPVSGLAREGTRHNAQWVTTGGSGFGVMAIVVGIERDFISRSDGLEQMQKIVGFLGSKADRFHGAFPHWMDGTTGKTVSFSEKDNGADLVETALLMQGLITVRQYFDGPDEAESALRNQITALYHAVEWDFFRKDGENVLYWHWSPGYGWEMNLRISGWNECLMVYILAAGSPAYGIPAEVYEQGWAKNGRMKNGKQFYGIILPLGEDYGGPLFFAQYSFIGLNPRDLKDQYAGYWEQNLSHTKINHTYCTTNPKGYTGYSADCWGLTASNIPDGYSASSPANDRGTIAPTAALSSFPYTPVESMQALRFFYYKLGDKLWNEDLYGFYDSFNLSRNWFSNDYLAIDQGPVICMIENYRTGLLWNLFMSAPEVKEGLTKLGFQY